GVTLGIAAGLFVGKQIGVFGTTYLAVKLGLARLPEGANWLGVYGAALLAGIGFTMSLFIGTLAWASEDFAAPLRLGVLIGSLASGVAGYLVLLLATRKGPLDAG
ncbi:MAG: Na+/H+ antiporter NhaA, partial [Dongiaceae bacterium]